MCARKGPYAEEDRPFDDKDEKHNVPLRSENIDHQFSDVRSSLEVLMPLIVQRAMPHLDRIWTIVQLRRDFFRIPSRVELDTALLLPIVQVLLEEGSQAMVVDDDRLRQSIYRNLADLYTNVSKTREDIYDLIGGDAVKRTRPYRRAKGGKKQSDVSDVRHVLSDYSQTIEHRREIEKKALTFDCEGYMAIKQATFRNLEASPADLKAIEEVYDSTLMRDEAFEYLLRGEHASLQKTASLGGMLHRFNPTKKEEKCLKSFARKRKQHLHPSPKRDLIDKMSGKDGKVGEYKVQGIFNAEQKLIAWLSYRVPPRDPVRRALHGRQVSDFLRTAILVPDFDLERMEQQAQDSMEIDTIASVQPGAGTALLDNVLSQLERENYGIQTIFLVRYMSMRLVSPPPPRKSIAAPPAANDASGSFFRRRGFVDVGRIYTSTEIACRGTKSGIICASPTWGLMFGEFSVVQARSAQEWNMMHEIHTFSMEE